MARKGENIFKRSDGRWEGRYIKGHENGRAVYGFVFGKTYMEAKEKKTLAIQSLPRTDALKPPGKSPILREIGERWMVGLETKCKASTIAKYRNQLDSHIYPAFGNIRISEINNTDMVKFSDELLMEKGLARKSASDIISRMKSIRRFALIHGYEVNFTPECVVIEQDAKEIRVLSFHEEQKLLEYLRSHPDLTSLGIRICLFTGIRIGELCALTWADIRLEQKELHIHRTMQRLQNKNKDAERKTYISIDEPKSKCSIRTIPIPDVLMEELCSAHADEAYLLTGQKDCFIEPRTMENRFSVILGECGIENANFHATRHTFATRCVEAGFDIKSLSEILGHANVNITLDRYVHPTMQLKHENMKKLSNLFAVK